MLIALTGYRGTGKTTVGQLLAERLGWRCVDTDAEIEALAGQSIRQLFDNDEEERFRDLESQVIHHLTRQHKLVLALGGGAVLREDNRQALSVAGPVVWLRAAPDTIFRRICDDPISTQQRPNLTQQGGLSEIEQLLKERLPIYESCADCTIDTDEMTPAQIADAILDALDIPPQANL